MEFLSTDDQECAVNLLLSDSCQDFTEELQLLMDSRDAFTKVPNLADYSKSLQVTNSETGSESGIVSPGSCQEDELLGSLFASASPDPFTSSSSSSNTSMTEHNSEGKVPLKESHIEKNRKNAIAARLNRQKKKDYVKGLETQVSSLQSENRKLRVNHSKLEETVGRLQTEVEYLKNVLANQSTLSRLLQNIPDVSNVRLTKTFPAGKRKSETDKDFESLWGVKRKRLDGVAGVCLHVVNETASLEFCAECSQRASSTVTV